MKVLVMGTGSYYQRKKAGIQGDVIAFVDNFKEGEYEGKEVIRPADTGKYNYDRIYIMSVHFISMGYQLLELGVAREKIYFGANTEPYNDFERNFISENKDMGWKRLEVLKMLKREGLLVTDKGKVYQKKVKRNGRGKDYYAVKFSEEEENE